MSRQERETIERTTSTGTTPETPPSARPGGIGEVREVRERETSRGPVTWEEIRAMTREAPTRAPLKTWRPVVGGIFSMIAGIWNIIVGAGILFGSLAADIVSPSFLWLFGTFALIGTAAGIALIITGVVATIGGMLAAGRRSWGLSMIGAIMALIPSPVVLPFLLGIGATTLIALGRREFGERREMQD